MALIAIFKFRMRSLVAESRCSLSGSPPGDFFARPALTLSTRSFTVGIRSAANCSWWAERLLPDTPANCPI